MSDTLMAIIGIFVAVILMFILPLTIMANKNDEIAQTVVQVAVSDFVDTVTKQGKITEKDYDTLIQKISATGNTFDVQIEAQILDDNPRRATTAVSSSQTGEYKYYSVYTNTILETISEEGVYELKKDDYIVVSVKNTNVTLATQFKNIFYKLTGKDTYAIGSSTSSIVLNSGNNVVHNIATTPVKPAKTEKEILLKQKKITEQSETLNSNLEVAVILDCTETTIPFHNNLDRDSERSSTRILQKIMSAVQWQNRGNMYFILNSLPEQVYNASYNTSWLKNGVETDTPESYATAMRTALNTLKDKEGTRCVVFLSYWPGREEVLKDAINVLKNNSDKYDIFFTTACCGNYDPENPSSLVLIHSSERYLFDYRIWHNAIPKEKSGGHLLGNDLRDKFTAMLGRTVIKQETIALQEQRITSNNLKVKLDNYNPNYTPSLTVNNSVYDVGNAISSDIIYFDSAQNTYILDLEMIKEILNISDERWINTEIQIEYVIQN